MSETVEQFIGNLPSPGAIQHKLDENAVERELLREILKLAKKTAAPASDKQQEAGAK